MAAHTVHAALLAVRAGLGRGPLPTVVGDAEPDLARGEDVEVEEASHLWLLVHPDLRKVARVRALVQHLEAAWGV